MDHRVFDEMTKRLSSDAPRRSIVKGGAAAALAALLGALRAEPSLAGCSKKGDNCNKNGNCCSKRCHQGKCKCSRPGDKCKKDKDCCKNKQVCKSNKCQDKKD